MEVGIDTFISSDNPRHHFKGTDTHDILMKATMFGNFITRLLLLQKKQMMTEDSHMKEYWQFIYMMAFHIIAKETCNKSSRFDLFTLSLGID